MPLEKKKHFKQSLIHTLHGASYTPNNNKYTTTPETQTLLLEGKTNKT